MSVLSGYAHGIMKIGHNLQLSDGEHFLSFEVKEVTAAMVKERNIDGRQ